MDIVKVYNQLKKYPLGKNLFSFIATLKAPYFSTISPVVQELTQTSCQIFIRKRRKVLNHIGTVHAIAMCNACELAFGLTMEAGVQKSLRWIPKAMSVRYLKKAETSLVAICNCPDIKNYGTGEHIVKVIVQDLNQVIVMDADITVYISPKKEVQ